MFAISPCLQFYASTLSTSGLLQTVTPCNPALCFTIRTKSVTILVSLTVQQLLQASPPPAAAAELLRLLAPGDLSALPGAGHALREAAHLLLHKEDVPAVPAVAITVGGAGDLPRHPPCVRRHVDPGTVAPAPRVAPRAPTSREHEHGSRARAAPC